MSDVEVRISGPLFDGRRDIATRQFISDLTRDIAGQALSEVQMILDRSIRNPTPYYETQINVRREGLDSVVNDRGVVYGPWLEGVGSRNRTTRFKGYAAFRRGKQAVRAKVPRLLQHALSRYTNRLGG